MDNEPNDANVPPPAPEPKPEPPPDNSWIVFDTVRKSDEPDNMEHR